MNETVPTEGTPLSDRRTTLRSWGISLVLHLLLLILLLILNVDLSMEEDFVEVSLTASRARTPSPVTVQTPAAEVRQQTSPPKAQTQPAESVPLPKRRMLEPGEPELLTARRQNLATASDPSLLENPSLRGASDEREQLTVPGRVGNDRREVAGSVPAAAGDKVLAPVGAATPGGPGAPAFEIEWMGTAREKLSGSLPRYPEGINENRVIRLSFLVNPAGEVTNALPIQKGQTEMENEAIRVLKTWRFNALEPAAPQVMQRGEITFNFRVR